MNRRRGDSALHGPLFLIYAQTLKLNGEPDWLYFCMNLFGLLCILIEVASAVGRRLTQ